MDVQLFQHHLLKRLPFLHLIAFAPLSQVSWLYRRRQWHPTPVLLPGESHGRRSLVGCNPWGHEESDMTEQLNFHFSLSCIGEGNGNPLQCSCLENPRDSGAWWAAIYGSHRVRHDWSNLAAAAAAAVDYIYASWFLDPLFLWPICLFFHQYHTALITVAS